MPGSSLSVAGPNIVLNTAVADVLSRFASQLEGAEDFESTLHDLIKNTIKEHKRIIFNGNGYDDAWIKEATEERGLLNLATTPEALIRYLEPKNIELFGKHGVFSEAEIRSRYEILISNYRKVIHIEALTMLDMVRKDIMPAVSGYTLKLANGLAAKKACGADVCASYEKDTLDKLCATLDNIHSAEQELQAAIDGAAVYKDRQSKAEYYKDKVIAVMEKLRAAVDEAETLTDRADWPYPSYSDLLFGIE